MKKHTFLHKTAHIFTIKLGIGLGIGVGIGIGIGEIYIFYKIITRWIRR